MRKLLASLFLLVLLPFVWAQVPMTGAGKGTPVIPYQGPGDVVSGALAWGSCARVYSLALASTSTSMCDLIAITGGAAVCTLRGSSTGFVDLAASYCAGTTPAAACAAASGGSCKVGKIYDQIGGTSGWIPANLGQSPVLTFSAANGLPGMTGTGANNTGATTSTLFTQALPITWVSVAARTANFTTASYLGFASGGYNGLMGFDTSANKVTFSGSASLFLTLTGITDGALHAFQAVQASGSGCVFNVDGTETSGDCTAQALSSNTSRLMRASGGASLNGYMMEYGFWPFGFNNTQRTNMNSNIHGINGYNF